MANELLFSMNRRAYANYSNLTAAAVMLAGTELITEQESIHTHTHAHTIRKTKLSSGNLESTPGAPIMKFNMISK